MNNHWPILAALILLLAAGAFGEFRREEAELAAAARPEIKLLGTPQAQRPPARTVSVEKPAEVAAVQPPVIPPVVAAPQPQPANARPLPAVGGAPAPAPVPNIVAPEAATAALNELRSALQALGGKPVDNVNGGFNFALKGASVDIPSFANWSILVFNDNPQAPQTESPNFKACLDTVLKVLQIDASQPFSDLPNGAKILKTNSRLGRITLTRTPANGNSCFIRPMRAGGAPVKPISNTPVAPPKPPGNDKF